MCYCSDDLRLFKIRIVKQQIHAIKAPLVSDKTMTECNSKSGPFSDSSHSPLRERLLSLGNRVRRRNDSAGATHVRKMWEGQRELLRAIEASQEAALSRLTPTEPHLDPVNGAEGIVTPLDLQEPRRSPRATPITIPRSKSAPPC